MQTPASFPPSVIQHGLWLVLTATGWSLGWGTLAQAGVEQAWPNGDPPVECPAPELVWALRQALDQAGPMSSKALDLHLLVGRWSGDAHPDWWPDRARRLPPWQQLAQACGLRLATVRLAIDDVFDTSVWDWAQRSAPDAEPLRRWHLRSMAWPRSPWWSLVLSGALAGALHVLLTQFVHPALLAQQLALKTQAEQAHALEQAQLAQARAQARHAERTAQLRQWQDRQRQGLAPLQALGDIVQSVARTPEPHWWPEMRWSQGGWTVWGITSHEAALRDLLAGPLSAWQPQRIESLAAVWPAAPEMGTPAWRYQLRLQPPRVEAGGEKP